jgi:hypothetical protein
MVVVLGGYRREHVGSESSGGRAGLGKGAGKRLHPQR